MARNENLKFNLIDFSDHQETSQDPIQLQDLHSSDLQDINALQDLPGCSGVTKTDYFGLFYQTWTKTMLVRRHWRE